MLMSSKIVPKCAVASVLVWSQWPGSGQGSSQCASPQGKTQRVFKDE